MSPYLQRPIRTYEQATKAMFRTTVRLGLLFDPSRLSLHEMAERELQRRAPSAITTTRDPR